MIFYDILGVVPSAILSCHVTVLRAVTKFLVTCTLILHTRSKFVTLWVNSIDNRQFHP